MFIKRRTRAAKVTGNQMFFKTLSFKTLVTYKRTFNLQPDNYVCCQVALVGQKSMFNTTWCLNLSLDREYCFI